MDLLPRCSRKQESESAGVAAVSSAGGELDRRHRGRSSASRLFRPSGDPRTLPQLSHALAMAKTLDSPGVRIVDYGTEVRAAVPGIDLGQRRQDRIRDHAWPSVGSHPDCLTRGGRAIDLSDVERLRGDRSPLPAAPRCHRDMRTAPATLACALRSTGSDRSPLCLISFQTPADHFQSPRALRATIDQPSVGSVGGGVLVRISLPCSTVT